MALKSSSEIGPDDEDAFGGDSTTENQLADDGDIDSDVDACSSSPSLAPHLVRKSQLLMSGASSLASPPPSHRRVVKPSSILLSPPSLELPTTNAKSGPSAPAKDMWDSDENPFLDACPGQHDATNGAGAGPTLEEQPNLTFV